MSVEDLDVGIDQYARRDVQARRRVEQGFLGRASAFRMARIVGGEWQRVVGERRGLGQGAVAAEHLGRAINQLELVGVAADAFGLAQE